MYIEKNFKDNVDKKKKKKKRKEIENSEEKENCLSIHLVQY